MASKYIKFGLRADRNLADLENPGEALGNLLNDISTQLDDNGDKTGFTTTDLIPLIGLRNTGLADNVTASGSSIDLASLNNSLVEYTPLDSSTTRLEIQPRITIQDNINNSKSVLADPPFMNGGDGPITRFIPSDRINPVINADTKGNSVSTGSTVAAAIAALGSNLYTTAIVPSTPGNPGLSPIVDGEDFWNNGIFQLGSKVHPTFPNTYGMIQWTGYLSSVFVQEWESTGLFMIEQDIVDDRTPGATENNWTTLKSVFSNSFTTDSVLVTWSNIGTVPGSTTTNVFISLDDIKHVCRGMKVTLGTDPTSYEVISVNELGGVVTIPVALAAGNAPSATFTWSPSDDLIRTGSLRFQEPRTGEKIRVRYTVWWPNPTVLSLPANSTYRTKRFAFAIEQSDRLPFSMIYSQYDRNQNFGQYTYEYFKRNRGSVLKQQSSFPLRVNATISLNYIPPNDLSSVVKGMPTGTTAVTPKFFIIRDSFGRIEGQAGTFTGCEVGDWLAFSISTNYYAYQIEEIRSDTVAYISRDFSVTAGVAVPVVVSNGVVFKSLGLVGLFRLQSGGGTAGSLYSLAGTAVPTTAVYPDYIAMGILLDGTSGFNPVRINTVDINTNPKGITTANYLPTSSTLPNTSTHICAIYSTRGLEDLSSVEQCRGVYGREVDATANAGETSITLTTNVGVAVGDFLQYAGTGGIADPVISEGTTVASVVTSGVGAGKVITINPGIRAGKALPKSATLIFIKAADRPSHVEGGVPQNKEYCVIPLNTAPPFEGTAEGLSTKLSNPSLIVKNFKFAQLDLTIPAGNIATTTVTSPTAYFPITYNGITYKALVS